MKPHRLLASVLCLSLLCACGGTPSSPPGDGQTAAPYEPSFAEAQAVRVVLPIMTSASGEAERSKANGIIADAGFSVTLEYLPSGYDGEDDLLDTVRGDLSGNTVYLLSQSQASKLAGEGILGDFYEAASTAAPTLTAGYAELGNASLGTDPNTMTAIPVGIAEEALSRTAVLVRSDLYADYGRDISTADDYEALLKSLKQADPGEVPGALSPRLLHSFYSDNLGLSLFLPAAGYVPFGMGLAVLGDTVTPVYALNETKDALERMASWKKDGLVTIYGWDTEAIGKLDQFPTLVVNTEMFLSDRTAQQFPVMNQLDFTGYTLCILYAETIPQLSDEEQRYVNTCGVAGPQADVTEFLRFLEWLQTPENYNRFTYGVEGEDYTLENGAIRYTDTPEPYGSAFLHYFFTNTDIPRLPNANAPANLADEVASVKYPSVAFPSDGKAWGEDMTEDEREREQERVNAAMGDLGAYLSASAKVLDNLQTQSYDAFCTTAESFLQTQRAQDPLGDYAELYNEELAKK